MVLYMKQTHFNSDVAVCMQCEDMHRSTSGMTSPSYVAFNAQAPTNQVSGSGFTIGNEAEQQSRATRIVIFNVPGKRFARNGTPLLCSLQKTRPGSNLLFV